MSDIEGFPPIVSANAKIIILGSMPSEASLLRQQYYGHRKNAFWPIMGALFDFSPELGYRLRKMILMENRVAFWDVMQSCTRSGSLDSNIKPESIRINDFASFFAEYKLIKQVFFNGKMAEKVYRQKVLPVLYSHFNYLEYQSLPSTSPAYASLNLKQKIEAWKVIKQHVVK